MQLAKWEWKKLLRDWKTRLLLLACLLFYGSFSLLYQQQTVSFPEEEMQQRYTTIQQLFNTIPSSVFEGESGQEVYDIMAEQQMLHGLQLYILTKEGGNTVAGFEQVFADYLQNGTKIAHNQGRLLELTDFEYYDYLLNFLPDEQQIQQDIAFFDYLAEHDLEIEWNSFSASNIFLQEVNVMIGIALFLFIALLGCDRFTKDQTKNWSITQGVPITLRKQWYLRTGQLWLLFWATSLGGLLISYLISLIFETPGSLMYPVLLYTGSGYLPIAIWQYALLALGSAMLLSFFLLLLAVGLSWVFRTIYLTIILVLSVYFIPFIWQYAEAFTAWLPSVYLHIEPVLMGETAQALGLPGITFGKGFLVLLLMMVILEGAFAILFDRIQTQTFGLQRRKRA